MVQKAVNIKDKFENIYITKTKNSVHPQNTIISKTGRTTHVSNKGWYLGYVKNYNSVTKIQPNRKIGKCYY